MGTEDVRYKHQDEFHVLFLSASDGTKIPVLHNVLPWDQGCFHSFSSSKHGPNELS